MSTQFEEKKYECVGEMSKIIFLVLINFCVFLFLKTASKLGKDYKYRLSQKNREICQDMLTWSPGSSPLFVMLTLENKSSITP